MTKGEIRSCKTAAVFFVQIQAHGSGRGTRVLRMHVTNSRKKTSLNSREVTQRGRNREEAVFKEGMRAVPPLVDLPESLKL
jgi:hypothetical protein